MQVFPLAKDMPVYMKYFYPIQQRDILKILDILKSKQTSAYIFGSSITDKCRVNSDIDICIVSDSDTEYYDIFRLLTKEINTNIDIINWNNIENESLMDEIKKGIYIKRGDVVEL